MPFFRYNFCDLSSSGCLLQIGDLPTVPAVADGRRAAASGLCRSTLCSHFTVSPSNC